MSWVGKFIQKHISGFAGDASKHVRQAIKGKNTDFADTLPLPPPAAQKAAKPTVPSHDVVNPKTLTEREQLQLGQRRADEQAAQEAARQRALEADDARARAKSGVANFSVTGDQRAELLAKTKPGAAPPKPPPAAPSKDELFAKRAAEERAAQKRAALARSLEPTKDERWAAAVKDAREAPPPTRHNWADGPGNLPPPPQGSYTSPDAQFKAVAEHEAQKRRDALLAQKTALTPDQLWQAARERIKSEDRLTGPQPGGPPTFRQEVELDLHKGEVGIPWKDTEAPGAIINKGKPRKTPDPL